MPSKTIKNADLEASGALLPVRIQPAGTSIPGVTERPQVRTVLALIDTGARATCVSPRVASALGLERLGWRRVETVGGPAVLPIYGVALVPLVDATEEERPHFVYVTVFGMKLGDGRFDCLLGRDILAAARFEYDGRDDSYGISF